MTDYERGFAAGREAAARVARRHRSAIPEKVSIGWDEACKAIALDIKSLHPPAPEGFEEWHARECISVIEGIARALRAPVAEEGFEEFPRWHAGNEQGYNCPVPYACEYGNTRWPSSGTWICGREKYAGRTCREVYAAEHPPQAEQAAREGEKPPERNLDRRAFEALVASCCNPVPIASTDKGRRVRIEFLAAPIEDALRQAFREGGIAGLHAKSEARGAEVLNEKVPGASRTPPTPESGASTPEGDGLPAPTGTDPLALAVELLGEARVVLARYREDAKAKGLGHRDTSDMLEEIDAFLSRAKASEGGGAS